MDKRSLKMKKIYLLLAVTLVFSFAFGKDVKTRVFEEVPTVVVEKNGQNLDVRVMYGFVRLYQENKSFNFGQVIVKIDDENTEDVKVLVTKKDLEKFVNRDVEFSSFIREYVKFI
eukprot:Anaeramoba_ignava/a647982_11.p1 GENE.a647982_11~~a647982_11.p1  ORF type:complete len:115 (-),score=19.20 a647982_11:30-374(-)